MNKGILEAGKKRLAGEVKNLRKEARDLKEVVAEQALELRLLKKNVRGWGRPRMRCPSQEKFEIIKLVEQSHLSTKQTLDKLGIQRSTFYRWYNLYQTGGVDALEDNAPMPVRVWNRIPDAIREQIVDLALNEPELSPRELAVRFTDT